MARFYPTLVSEQIVDTINFYEDYFGFVPTFEKEGYALLQDPKEPDTCIAVFDAHHDCVSRLEQSVQGVIITMAVDDIEAAYDNLYMEGLEMYKHMGVDVHGDRHFVVYDPNGILVNVIEGKFAKAQLAA
jgi:uncharacterized glyoxalase superfamily protein PhnB